MKFPALVEAIDDAVANVQGTPRNQQKPGERDHLGASVVGRDCVRELVYGFRQMTKVKHEGRILRLFGRGHDEEPRFVELLEMIGCVVRTVDPETVYDLWHDPDDLAYVLCKRTAPDPELLANWNCVTDNPLHVAAAFQQGLRIPKPKQFKFIGYKGHFSGSLDGDVTNIPGIEQFGFTREDVLLAEYKTHGEKSFKLLVADGVQRSKPEHYVQCQVYMKEKGYKAALYLAVNKNTDEIYAEIVLLDPLVSIIANRRASDVIDARVLPPRIPYASPSFFRCSFCDHKAVCHMGAPAPKSCRSCAFGYAIEGKRWQCSKWGLIPDEVVPQGCDSWRQITD